MFCLGKFLRRAKRVLKVSRQSATTAARQSPTSTAKATKTFKNSPLKILETKNTRKFIKFTKKTSSKGKIKT